MFGFSHVKFISQMANVIADHGHNVTLFQPYHIAMKNTEGLIKNKNIEVLNYFPNHYDELLKSEVPTFPIFWDSQIMNNPILFAFMMAKTLGKEFERTAEQVLKDTDLHEKLKSKKFDVVLVETFELSGFYLAHLIDVPAIPIMSAVRFPVFDNLFGQPSQVGYIPQTIGMERMAEYQFNRIEKFVGKPVPHWKELIKQSPVYITNSNPYLDFAVPTTATIVHAGGITIDLKKLKNVGPLPEEYEKILQERDSTVLISFGSVIRSFQMPDSFKAGLIKMFESLPEVTFIWKYEKDDVEFQKRLPKNVHLKKWVPQPALLSDERLKDGEKMTRIMRDLVSNPKYNEKAQELLSVLSNQPIDPKFNFMKHLEFAIEFPNLRSQVPAINHVGIVAHYYLDVLGFLVLTGSLLTYLTLRVVSKVLRRFVVKKTKND
uniref:glucuronosyltransferase n=1 Tax=Caenorhabditis tropicalis TaxID=1561998 RepID=A0A1I7V201_9PELO